jgi:hypothetical protein
LEIQLKLHQIISKGKKLLGNNEFTLGPTTHATLAAIVYNRSRRKEKQKP